MNNNIEEFIASCDDLITCKFLVAEYKIQKLLQQLAKTEEVCSLVGECLEEYNRDREFAKTFIQDGHGEFMCDMPEEEYKIIALVFCTLVDIDNKKIDFTDFIKRFFGREENAFESFIKTMVIPFRNLIADAFGYPKINLGYNPDEKETEKQTDESDDEDEDDYEDQSDEEQDKFILAQKIAVQILGELQYQKPDYNVETSSRICKAIIKTAEMRDEDITISLILALKEFKVKSVKFMVKELFEVFDL